MFLLILLLLNFILPLISALDNISYGAFTQTATYSIAAQHGFFSAQNLSVDLTIVPNSSFAYSAVQDGTFDILTGTIDNAVNLRFNSNASLTVLGQLDEGPDLVLASVPSITNISQLEGKTLIVDSPTSGYAYLLRRVLSDNGLVLNTDYTFQTVGATTLRYADLIAGQLPNGSAVYGTILTYPFTAQLSSLPLSQRPQILAPISSSVQPISSSAFTTSENSLQNTTTRNLLTRFLASMLAANRFLSAAENKDAAIAAIGAQLNVSTAVAELEYEAALDPVSGETTAGQQGDFQVDQLGLANIIAVRQQFGGFANLSATFNFTEATTPGVGRLIDYEVRDEAVQLLSDS